MALKLFLTEKLTNNLQLDKNKVEKVIANIGCTSFGSKDMGMDIFADELCQIFNCDDFTYKAGSIYYKNDIRLCSVEFSHEGYQNWAIYKIRFYPNIEGLHKVYDTNSFYCLLENNDDYLNEAFIEYNANMNGKDVGDCVKRQLSFALQIDYKQIAKELRQTAKDLKYPWNNPAVYVSVLREHGIDTKTTNTYNGIVKQFADSHTKGTYIIECGKSGKWAEHLTCVMNGDIYDSWDCSDYKIIKYYIINDLGFSVNKEFNVTNLAQDIYNFAYKLLTEKLYPLKINEQDITVNTPYSESATNIYFLVTIYDGKIKEKFTYNFNPTHSVEQNVQYYKNETIKYVNKLCIKCKKFIKFFNIVNTKLTADIKFDALYYFNNPKTQQIILGMPEQLYDRITYISCLGNYIDIYCDAFSEDPRYDAKDPKVLFSGETAKEILYQMTRYVKDYSRVNYDF